MNVRIEYTDSDLRKIFISLLAIVCMLVFIYGVIHIWKPYKPWGAARELFDLDAETTIPAWFSSIQLFVLGGVLFLASKNNQRKQHLPSALLLAGSVFFIFLSADEGAAIHEKMTDVAVNLNIKWMLFKGDHGAWISVYFLLAMVALIFVSPYLRKLWIHFRRETGIALFGLLVFVMGGIGFEIISYLFLRADETARLYKMEVACEEFFEMSGVSIMLYAVLLLTKTISTVSPVSVSGKTIDKAHRFESRKM